MSVSYFVRYDIAVADLEDFKRFMTFEGTVTHQAMRSEEVYP